MKNLIILALIAFAAWYGYKHYAEFRGKGQNEILVTNQASRDVVRLRIQIGERTEVIDTLKVGATEKRSFPPPPADGTFKLTWNYMGFDSEPSWSGGVVAAGPMLMSHHFLMQDGGDVIWSSEPRPEKAKGKGLQLP